MTSFNFSVGLRNRVPDFGGMTGVPKDWGLGKTRLTETPLVYCRNTGKDIATVHGDKSDTVLIWNAPAMMQMLKSLCSVDALNGAVLSDHDRKVLKDARALVETLEQQFVTLG